MATQRTSAIVKYSKPGTQPPIYLAGSFSNPEWTPLPMSYTINEHGEYLFTKEVDVEEAKEYQYKFRVGEGEWWLLNEDEPTVTDDVGNRNNLLKMPLHEEKATEVEETKEEHAPATMTEPTPAQPTVAVEKVDSEPSHGDDFGPDATTGQKDAHKLRAQDAEPDSVVVRAETNTPDIANCAAEVADSAMDLDREEPTPPMSDDEAGRIGYRRMSQTPIPEVAETAAEVADVAVILDKANMPKLDMPAIPSLSDFDGPMTPGTETPPEDKVPLFAHECLQPPPGGFESPIQSRAEPPKSKLSFEESAIDYDDPTLEEFPSDHHAILEKLKTSQSRLAEDQTSFDGIPPSPVVGPKSPNHQTERMEIPSISPNIAALSPGRSPSLESIPEAGEEGYRKEVLASLPEGTNLTLGNGEPQLSQNGSVDEEAPKKAVVRKPSIDVHEVLESPPSLEPKSPEAKVNGGNPNLDGPYMEPEPAKLPVTPFVLDNSKQLGESTKEVVVPDEGPQITVQPATPGSSLKTTTMDPFSKPSDTAKATAIEEQNGRSQLKSRKPSSPPPERSVTPTSVRSAGKDAKSRNFLNAFWRVVFVEWIGGFIMRLCGGDRHKA